MVKKNLIYSTFAIAVSIIIALFTFSCQRSSFSAVEENSKMNITIPDDNDFPPPPPPPPVIPKPVLSKGACNADSSTVLTSCMKCNVPVNPPPPPQFSQKGQSLIDIMSVACAIPNKSAPKNYVPPSKDQLIARLNRLSPTLYPDSNMSQAQINVIQGLKSDVNLQKKMFGGLWYQPPYSDSFETYFGIEVGEAVTQLCYNSADSKFNPYNATPLVSKQYIDCQYQGDPFNCKETSTYIQANTYRTQLRGAMVESIKNPYVPPAPTASKSCSWEKFEGLYSEGGAEQLGLWLVGQQKVSLEVIGTGARCSVISQIPSGSDIPQGNIIMSAYICK